MTARQLKKRHHFVPQFYLRGFAAPGKGERIWTYDTERGEARQSSIENTAFEKHLYSATLEDGTRRDDIEDLVADIEGKAAPVLDKLIRGSAVTDQERADFASFIALAYVRTDAFRHQYAQMMAGALQVQLYATAAHNGSFESLIRRFQQDTGPLKDEQIEELRNAMLRPKDFAISVDKERTLEALALHDELVPIFYRMRWAVMTASEPRYFITSDNPLVYGVPRERQGDLLPPGGLAHKKVEVTLPLSVDTCLLAGWDEDMPERFELSREVVKHTNRLRAVYARRFLFGPRHDQGIARLGAKYAHIKPGVQIGGPTELSPVSLHRS